MKAELRLAAHSMIGGAQVVEIWWDGEFIGQVCGADGPGVRVVSKYTLQASNEPSGKLAIPLFVVEVKVQR